MEENQKVGKYKPWKPIKYDILDVQALQALERGEATEEQQKRALAFIIKCAGTYEVSYQPDSPRDTDFAEGKRYIGLTIVKMLHINSMQMDK